MRRRDFLGLIGASLVCSRPARAQTEKIPKIGLLFTNAPEEVARMGVEEAFRQGLRDLGYADGKSITIEVHYAGGDLGRLPDLVGEIIAHRPDIIVASSEAALAAARATSTIPIVSTSSQSDLIHFGFAESLSHPGRNITGMVSFGPEIAAKRLELVKQVDPSTSRVGALLLTGFALNRAYLEAQSPVAQSLAMELRPLEADSPETYDAVFVTAREASIRSIVVTDTARFFGDAKVIAVKAEAQGLAMYGSPSMAAAGQRIGHGPDSIYLFRHAATFVDKILRGAKPGDIPIEQASRFLTIVNLKTAAKLHIDIPPAVLAAADEVIE